MPQIDSKVRMKFSIKQIAQFLDAEIEGKADARIDQIAKIETASAGTITFLANPKYEAFIYETQASAVIVSRDFTPQKPISATLLRVKDPYGAFTLMLEEVARQQQQELKGIEDHAFVSPDASVAEDVYIGAFAYIGPGAMIEKGAKIFPHVYIGQGVKVGEGTIIHPHSCIYHATEIGKGCILHAGCNIGSDGFGFAPQADGTFKKIPQTGNVVIEDEVEIGAGTCIDRATVGSTHISKGVKLDNLVQIAHNVTVDQSSVIAAQAGIAGSTHLGKYCMIGGQVGIVGHLTLADQTKIDAQSGVNRSIKKPGQAFRGSPIQPFRQQLKSEVLFRKLEEMQKKIHSMEQALAQRE